MGFFNMPKFIKKMLTTDKTVTTPGKFAADASLIKEINDKLDTVVNLFHSDSGVNPTSGTITLTEPWDNFKYITFYYEGRVHARTFYKSTFPTSHIKQYLSQYATYIIGLQTTTIGSGNDAYIATMKLNATSSDYTKFTVTLNKRYEPNSNPLLQDYAQIALFDIFGHNKLNGV